MKDKNNFDYSFFESVVLRAPNLPFNNNITKDYILNSIKNKTIQEAIYIASPSLYFQLKKWEEINYDPKYKDSQKIFISMYKYLSRMSTRPTPYGLFAGCGIVNWGNDTNLIKLNDFSKTTRIDYDYINAFLNKILKETEVIKLSKFYSNNSLYKLGEKYRYTEYYYNLNSKSFILSQFERNSHIEKVLDFCKNGCSFDTLLNELASNEISKEEAEEFLLELINCQVIINEFELSITDSNFINTIINNFEIIDSRSENLLIKYIVFELKKVQTILNNIDRNSTNEIDLYEEIKDIFENLNNNFSKDYIFQTDKYDYFDGSFSINYQNQIINTLIKLSKIENNKEERLKDFISSFEKKYENKEVSLAEALDPDIGILYNTGKDTINKIADEFLIQTFNNSNLSISKNELRYIEILSKTSINNSKELDLNLFLKNEDNQSQLNLPETLSVFGKVIDSEKSIIQIFGCYGASASNLIARFAPLNIEIASLLNEVQDFEKKYNKDAIVAEILHLPEDRIGNVIIRPSFREYDIEYLAKSQKKNILSINDLFLKIINGKLVLFSKKHNKKIMPRLSCAHNYSFNSLPIYKFLCDYQFVDTESGLSFNWPDFLKEIFVYFPRVIDGNVIVSPATWVFNKSRHYGNEKDFESSIVKILKEHDVPTTFLLSDFDNELLINTEEELSFNVFIKTIKGRDNFTIKEFLYTPEKSLIKGTNNESFTNEFIALLKKNEIKSDNSFEIEKYNNSINSIKRDFPVGSEWVYFKVYCGYKTSEEFLNEILMPFLKQNETLYEKWFFIRYNDPNPHLRIRFYSKNKKNISKLILEFSNIISNSKLESEIDNFYVDTYKREIERYGIETIEDCETIFCLDSNLIIELLSELSGFNDENEDFRLLLGVLLIDMYLEIANKNNIDKLSFVSNNRDAFLNEHSYSKLVKQKLSEKYRDKKNLIESFIYYNQYHEDFNTIINLINDYKEKISEILTPILGKKSINKDSVLSSIIHMSINRLYYSHQRTCEMYVYDILAKYYLSIEARKK